MAPDAYVRRSAIMGTWYPDDPAQLRALIERYLANVPAQSLSGELRALIAPHAGYQYSGQTAAYGYKQIIGRAYEAVIVVGPSHRAWVGDYAIADAAAYETTLGRVPLAAALINELEEQLGLPRVREHHEHSLELQLPFLQYVLGDFSLVPILMTADALQPCLALGRALAALMRGRNMLLVASSDLNHLESYAAVVQRDAEVRRAIQTLAVAPMADVLLHPAYTVCGRAPILTVSAAAQAWGATRVDVLHYTNSGDVTGRRAEGQYTVGYLSAAFVT